MPSGFVAFIDVLGFSALVSGEQGVQRVQEYLNCLNGALENTGDGPGIEYVVFSDSIIITIERNDDAALQKLVQRCSILFATLLRHGIPVRGAISHGSFLSKKTPSGTFVAGRAIIEAYTFEGRQDWVGIMIAPSVIAHVSDLESRCHPGRPEWGAYVRACRSIPFHGTDPREPDTYDGFAIVPSNGTTAFPELIESVRTTMHALSRLMAIAPDPRSQAKYARTRSWLSPWAVELKRASMNGL